MLFDLRVHVYAEVAVLLRSPGPLGVDLWCTKVLPFLCPQDPALRDTADPSVYPSAVAAQLAAAAERCRRTCADHVHPRTIASLAGAGRIGCETAE